MDPIKCQHEVSLITTLLRDVHMSHGAVFNATALKNTTRVVVRRTESEGMSFLTKTLPALGKALDRALSGGEPLDGRALGFSTQDATKLPIFMGEFFRMVLASDGSVTPGFSPVAPNTIGIKVLRQVLYLFYKYKLPYSSSDEQKVIRAFIETERDLGAVDATLGKIRECIDFNVEKRLGPYGQDYMANTFRKTGMDSTCIVLRARLALRRVLAGVDLYDIYPSHGPGVVSTKETAWGKYVWRRVNERITALYPYDAFFCASMSAVCDNYKDFSQVLSTAVPAQVILVPKDSRGPRLISCEPVDNQWIQQGIRKVLYQRVESHDLTRGNVFFTNQTANRIGAQVGSIDGHYATLDLKEASDRVSLELVRLLFPEELLPFLECCRSCETVLPNGEVLPLRKFAPMGSALCFPIMALTIWALLDAIALDQYTHERILVYGDDVIVPTAFAEDAITVLEMFGLKVNHQKSCTKGLFRESCGMDAYRGIDVTPVKIKTVWSNQPSPEVFLSYVAYANAMWDAGHLECYELIVGWLTSKYWPIANKDMLNSPVSLSRIPVQSRGPCPVRYNPSLQRREYKALEYVPMKVTRVLPGWIMLLRYFVEVAETPTETHSDDGGIRAPHSVSQYTIRNMGKLIARWR